MSRENMKPNIAIIGLGLIGGSLALALRRHQVVDRIIGIDADEATRSQAKVSGMVDSCYQSLAQMTETVNIVVLATPVSTFDQLALDCKKHLPEEVTISDVGSTKKNLFTAFSHAYGELPTQLMPAHPIAGSERSGIAAADAELFHDRSVILVPTNNTGAQHKQMVHNLWQALHCRLDEMSAQYHDLVLAKTSHIPHLLSFAMVHYLAGESENYDIFRFAAGGFRDLTRMAVSDPEMWSSIFAANRDNMLSAIDGLTQTLADLRSMIEDDDKAAMYNFITEAKKAREHYAEMI